MSPYTPPKPADHIPVVDLRGSFADNPDDRRAVAHDIRQACCDTGFFYIENHRIDRAVVDRAFEEAKAFFELPLNEKKAVDAADWLTARGYEGMQKRALDSGSPPDLMESFFLGRDLPLDHPYVQKRVRGYGPNQWPKGRAAFRDALETYHDQVVDLGHHLMKLLALSLELEENYFEAAYRNFTATLRLHRYVPQPVDAVPNQIGAGAHTDYGAITILAQDDCGGLEVQNIAGDWLRADPVPGTFVVNLGDMIRRWTNDIYHSNMHRVRNASGRDRYSMALFFNPDYFARIECVPTCWPAAGEPLYEACIAGEHVAERIRLSFEAANVA
jgi:isopenicillin N synthase-like dioxygenase